MWLKDAKRGWKMVEASRKEVPDQKVSRLLACRECAMVGRQGAMEVPSSEIMRVRKASGEKARRRAGVVLKGGGVLVVAEGSGEVDSKGARDAVADLGLGDGGEVVSVIGEGFSLESMRAAMLAGKTAADTFEGCQQR